MSISVTVKAGGLLYEHLPPARSGNRAQLTLAEGTTLGALMREELAMPEATYLVIVNGELVPEGERAGHRLGDGDQVSINPPLKGG